MKFGRAYEFSIIPNRGGAPINLIQGVDTTAYQNNVYVVSHPVARNGTISNGITIKFTIQKGFQVNNEATIELFNLNKNTRAYLEQDRFTRAFSTEVNGKVEYRIIKLQAGYMDARGEKKIFDTIFQGDLIEGGSSKTGADFITKLHCQENGFYNNSQGGLISKSYGVGALLRNLVEDCLNSLDFSFDNLRVGGLAGRLNDPIRKQSFFGRGYQILKQYFGDNFYITDGVPYLILQNEAIRGTLQTIEADTGLLESPIKRDNTLEIKLLFEPRITLGQYIAIKSETVPQFNGGYKVISVRHQGTISPAVEENLTTTVELLKSSFIEVNF